MEILRPAREPEWVQRRRRQLWAIPTGFLIGTGLGAIAFFGWLVPGLGLVTAGLIVYDLANR